MNVDVIGIEEIGNGPAVEVVLGETLIGQVAIGVGEASGLLGFQYLSTDGLVVSTVIALVELVAAAELRTYGVPQKLKHLHATHGVIAIGAANVFVKILANVGILEVAYVGVQVDERAAEILLDDFFDSGISDSHKPTIRKRVVCIGQHGIADPLVRIVGH